MGAVTSTAYRTGCTDNSRRAQQNHKALTCQRSLIQAEHIQKTPAIQRRPIRGPLALQSSFCRGNAELLLLVFTETQRSTVQKRGFSPLSPFTVLSPQVTFLCNLSLETITLPRSPDAHQHTEQMRRQGWETGRLQSDTSQVWLCGHAPPL